MTPATRHPALARTTVVLALLVVVAGLTGCGSAADAARGKAEDKVSVNTDQAEAGAGTDQGSAIASKALPDGFPAHAVPLIDATVVTGSKGAPDGQYAWSVVMQTQRAIDDVAAEVEKDFAAAGYRTRQAHQMGDVTIMQFADSRYRVGVTVTRTGGTVTVTYVVRDA